MQQLYKGKSIYKHTYGSWITGNYLNINKKHYIIPTNIIITNSTFEEYEVLLESVGVYVTKDYCGLDVYTGDTVDVCFGTDIHRGIVYYNEKAKAYGIKVKGGFILFADIWKSQKDNIYIYLQDVCRKTK